MSVTVRFKFCPNQEVSLVEVAGSFNNWTRVAMTRLSGRSGEWTISLKVKPGQHCYKYIVDKEWRHDPGQPTTNDNMGGHNNIIIVSDVKNEESGELSKEDIEFLVKTTNKSEKEVNDYYKLFKIRHPTGKIDMKDFIKMTKDFIAFISEKIQCNPIIFCDYAFKSYDTDENGFISFREAAHAMYINREGGPIHEKIRFAFRMYDINKDGAIEKKELFHWMIGIMGVYGEKLDAEDKGKLEKELKEMINLIDTNKDGIISEEEFTKACVKDNDLFESLCCYPEFIGEIMKADLQKLEWEQEMVDMKKDFEELECGLEEMMAAFT